MLDKYPVETNNLRVVIYRIYELLHSVECTSVTRLIPWPCPVLYNQRYLLEMQASEILYRIGLPMLSMWSPWSLRACFRRNWSLVQNQGLTLLNMHLSYIYMFIYMLRKGGSGGRGSRDTSEGLLILTIGCFYMCLWLRIAECCWWRDVDYSEFAWFRVLTACGWRHTAWPHF